VLIGWVHGGGDGGVEMILGGGPAGLSGGDAVDLRGTAHRA
jgi:hypothetical protein